MRNLIILIALFTLGGCANITKAEVDKRIEIQRQSRYIK